MALLGFDVTNQLRDPLKRPVPRQYLTFVYKETKLGLLGDICIIYRFLLDLYEVVICLFLCQKPVYVHFKIAIENRRLYNEVGQCTIFRSNVLNRNKSKLLRTLNTHIKIALSTLPPLRPHALVKVGVS